MREHAARSLVRRGTCHLVGDDVSLDDGIIPQRFAAQRVTDPRELVPHLFESIDPELAQRIKPGDIVLAGRNFACGKPRLQGFIAMAALDLAVICTSMPYKMLRRAVARAIPVIVGGPEPSTLAVCGDEIEADFSTGAVWNSTRDLRTTVPAMPPILRDIVASGGMQATLTNWLAGHPEQALQRD
jgi:3-isopropylmalate/(R)-2-methylmalate dehydratase small subunit